MQKEEEDIESGSDISSTERVHLVVRDLTKVYAYGFAGSIIALISGIIINMAAYDAYFAFGNFVDISTGTIIKEPDPSLLANVRGLIAVSPMLSTFVIGSGALILFNTIRWGRKAVREMVLWDREYIKLTYLVRFESIPPIGKTPQERLFNQLVRSFPELRIIIGPKIREKPELVKEFIDREVTVRKMLGIQKKIYRFDVAFEKQVRKWFSQYGYLLVKRFEQDKPVSVDQVAEVLQFADHLKEDNWTIYRVICVTTSAFDDKVIEFLEERWDKKKRACDLVIEHKDGYLLEWMDRSVMAPR